MADPENPVPASEDPQPNEGHQNPEQSSPLDIDREYQELWNRLDDSLLGRSGGIWVETGKQPYTPEQQRKMGVELHDESRKEFVKIFHALPANQEGTQHVLLTPDGEMLLVGVQTGEILDHKKDYDSAFGETEAFSDAQLDIMEKQIVRRGKSVRHALYKEGYLFFGVDMVKSSYDPVNTQEVHQAFEKAIKTAHERLEVIQKTKHDSKTKTVDGLRNLLNPPSTPPESPPKE